MRVQQRAVCGVIALCLSVGAGAERRSVFGNQSKPLKAKVSILAVSSSSRQSFAGNQEIYLADVQLKDGSHQFARLIDQYPGYGLPIRDSVLKAHPMLQMKVTREPECDLPGSRIYLGKVESAVFDGSVRDSLAAHRGRRCAVLPHSSSDDPVRKEVAEGRWRLLLPAAPVAHRIQRG